MSSGDTIVVIFIIVASIFEYLYFTKKTGIICDDDTTPTCVPICDPLCDKDSMCLKGVGKPNKCAPIPGRNVRVRERYSTPKYNTYYPVHKTSFEPPSVYPTLRKGYL